MNSIQRFLETLFFQTSTTPDGYLGSFFESVCSQQHDAARRRHVPAVVADTSSMIDGVGVAVVNVNDATRPHARRRSSPVRRRSRRERRRRQNLSGRYRSIDLKRCRRR